MVDSNDLASSLLEPVACNLCGGSAFNVLYNSTLRLHDQERLGAFIASTDRFDHYGRIVRCHRCGLTYTNPRPRADVIARGYAEATDTEGNAFTLSQR